MSKAPPPLVLVQWEDAAQMDSGVWADNSDKHEYKPVLHWQVGFLLAKTRKGLVLTQSWSEDSVAARDAIPRGMVRSITYLGPAAPLARKKKAD